MVRGEPQILSQVRRALRLAEEEGAAGRVLGSLFRAAVRTGRRVRAGTAIGASPTAFVDAGLRLAGRSLGELRGRPALVVGAGQMASLVVTQLREHGADPIRVVGRNAERARALAQRAGGEAHSLADLRRAMADAQLVVACTGAAGLVVMAEDVAAANDPVAAGHRRRFFLDLAVPRDVDPAVAGLPGMRLADVDDLKAAVEGSGDADQVFAQAEVIVAEEVRRFADRQRAARLAPLIQALRDRGERILAAELSKAAPRLASLQPRERAAVDALARAIVAKLLHEPIVRVKALPAADGANPGDANARALAELFGLDQAGDPPTA
jgi:glutamyl-tRNA reductase